MTVVKRAAALLVLVSLWAALCGYLALEGFWLQRVAAVGDHAGFARWASTKLQAENAGSSALVLLESGAVAVEDFSTGIDPETLFPTASASKFIAALTALRLAEQQHLDLDRPVSDYLTRWQLPPSAHDLRGVTARRLLSHTAGLTDALGFGDYKPDEQIPSLEESLQVPRASSGEPVKIAIEEEPGSGFRYSGGGYLIIELVIEEVCGMRFAACAREQLLAPLYMQRSTHDLPAVADNVSPSYRRDGSLAPSYRYASAAATGFASTAGDLTRLARALLGVADSPLQAHTLATMRQPQAFVLGAGIWGTGTMLYAPAGNGDSVFGHDGANDPALNTALRLNPVSGDGFILLLSGHPSLASDIGAQWVLWQTGKPDFLSTELALVSAVKPLLLGNVPLTLLIIGWWWRQRQQR